MGTWTPEIVPTGTWQYWREDAPGDWPDYDDPDHAGALSEGVIPDPCATCGGVLARRRLVANQGEINAIEYQNRRTAALRAKVPLLAAPEPLYRWDYDLRHRRACIPHTQPHLPVGGDCLPLRPQGRTED